MSPLGCPHVEQRTGGRHDRAGANSGQCLQEKQLPHIGDKGLRQVDQHGDDSAGRQHLFVPYAITELSKINRADRAYGRLGSHTQSGHDNCAVARR